MEVMRNVLTSVQRRPLLLRSQPRAASPCPEADRACGGAAQRAAAGEGSAQADAVVAPHPSADDAGGGCAYLRMSGRWLEEYGFVIGADVQVLVEQRRVTLISDARA
jgi:hypothetical protein